MKNKYLARLLKLGSLALAVLVCVLLLQDLLLVHADHNRERMKGYYLEDENSLDVVLIGSSEVYSDYAAPHAFNEHGFTSYPYATQACSIINYKTMLKEVLRTQNPQLIVVEINGALMSDSKLLCESSFNTYVDNIPFNGNKRELVGKYSADNEIEHYVPIIKYHDVWKSFPLGLKWDQSVIQDRLRGYNLLKGVKTKTSIYTPKGNLYREADIHSALPLSSETDAALRDFLDYCRDNNINNILFARFPHLVSDKNYERAQRSITVRNIVESYGYKYVSFYADIADIGLDVNRDFYNLEHLNVFGQKKFTSYFSRYLMNRYNLAPTVLNAEGKANWNDSVRYYNAFYNRAAYLTDRGVAREMGENVNTIAIIDECMNE